MTLRNPLTIRPRSRRIRAALAASAAAVALPMIVGTPAHADTTVTLPSQNIVKTLKDGTKLTISRTAEKARISPSMGGTPLHRNAWVSARYHVKTSDKKARFKIGAGYIVGCQLTLGAKANGTGSGTAAEYNPESATATGQVGGGVTIGPGQTANYVVNDYGYADDFGAAAHTSAISFANGEGTLLYKNQTMMINGCAGYAQARSYVKVGVQTDHLMQVVFLYGKPFSLG